MRMIPAAKGQARGASPDSMIGYAFGDVPYCTFGDENDRYIWMSLICLDLTPGVKASECCRGQRV